jgi:hypothetical protein
MRTLVFASILFVMSSLCSAQPFVSVYTNMNTHIIVEQQGFERLEVNGPLVNYVLYERAYFKIVSPYHSGMDNKTQAYKTNQYNLTISPWETRNGAVFIVMFCPRFYHGAYHVVTQPGDYRALSQRPRNCCNCCFNKECTSHRRCTDWYRWRTPRPACSPTVVRGIYNGHNFKFFHQGYQR